MNIAELKIAIPSNDDGYQFLCLLNRIGIEVGNGMTIGNTTVRWRSAEDFNVADIHDDKGVKVGTFTVRSA